ncbi:DUF397 domain-containing protein [Actinocorallia populi]|uniref:DUF397 domain-containing protein n=1 Tax=Actinocorallia populi TaxID=2079200 RepID=UPI000D090296|nr:DUF397 domain-containing protein [Actinocorallia populi]
MSTPDLSSACWRKSTHSDPSGDNCVEVAGLPGVIAVRDSKNPDGPRLAFSHTAFASFTRHLRTGS